MIKKLLLSLFFSLKLLASDGSIDASFGGGVVSNSNLAVAYTLYVQVDGKILIGGETLNNNCIIARYNANGTVDTAFSGGQGFISDPDVALVYDIAVQADGKILAVGKLTNGTDSFLYRYNSDGSVDNTFTQSQIVGDVQSIILTPDSKIIVAGYTITTNESILIRYNSDGTLDNTITFDSILNHFFYDVILQADGKVVACGGTTTADGFAIRYNLDGTVETTFESIPGLVFFGGLALTPNGEIFAFGGDTLTLAKYKTDGTLDTTFNGTGYNSSLSGNTSFQSVVLQSDGKPVIVAQFSNNAIIARFTQTGAVDFLSQIPTNSQNLTIGIQQNGYNVAAGRSTTTSTAQVLRYVDSPPLVNTTVTFPTSGSFVQPGTINFSGTVQNPSDVYIYIDGILADGFVTDPSGVNTWSYSTDITDLGAHTIEAISIYKDQKVNISSNVILFTVGDPPPPPEPTPDSDNSSNALVNLKFNGTFIINKFLNKTERVIFASWQANTNAILYKIYKKNKVICTIKPNGSNVFSKNICLQRCDQVSDFSLSFVTASGLESPRSVLTLS